MHTTSTLNIAHLLRTIALPTQSADDEWQIRQTVDAPYHNSISLLAPDENRISRVIADLLDPNGSHAQGDVFLKLFLQQCRFEQALNLPKATVRRECCTIFIERLKRRIDILIDGIGWGIGIENKAWAVEQKQQFPDYAEDLQKRFAGNFLLVRLAGDDSEVKTLKGTIGEHLINEGKFLTWRFAQDVHLWIVACRAACQAERVRYFLGEFDSFITSEFGKAVDPRVAMEHKHVRPELERVLSEDLANVRSAAAIAELFPLVRQAWVDEIFQATQKNLLKELGKGWLTAQSEGLFIEDDWASLMLWHKSWGEIFRIRLESQPKHGYVVLGIWHDKSHGLRRDVTLQRELKRLGWGEKTGGSFWEAHSPLPEPFRNWASTRGTVALRTEQQQLIELLVSEFSQLGSTFKDPLAERVRKIVSS